MRAFFSLVAISFCVFFAAGVLISSPLKTGSQTLDNELASDAIYEIYSDSRLADLRSSNQPVFVNMTAAWCITCLVNERIALSSDVFATALKDNNITYLKGDWTNNDPEITEVLKRYQTSGVPLYLMFPVDSALPAEVLPQILTESIMLEAMSRI